MFIASRIAGGRPAVRAAAGSLQHRQNRRREATRSGPRAGRVIRPDNAYSRSKADAENVVRSYSDRISTTIVRISETYGPGDFRLLKLFKAIDSGLFVMIGSGRNQRQIIHVDDLIRGLLLAATRPAAIGETFVLAGEELITTRDMVAHHLGDGRRGHPLLEPCCRAAVRLLTRRGTASSERLKRSCWR